MVLRFEVSAKRGGLLLVNSSMTDEQCCRNDIEAYYIPANDLAKKCGSQRAANMVMLGAYPALSQVLLPINIIEAFKKVFGEKGKKLIPLNIKALEKGMGYVLAQRRNDQDSDQENWSAPEAA